MQFQVYILYSNKLKKYYTGYSGVVPSRIADHNNGLSAFTKTGTPWKSIWVSDYMTKTDALRLEKKIKKRGAKRFLNDLHM